jgi:hypothetical protein
MQKGLFFNGQRVSTEDMTANNDGLIKGIMDGRKDFLSYGVISGMNITINGSNPTHIDVAQGVAFNAIGDRIAITSDEQWVSSNIPTGNLNIPLADYGNVDNYVKIAYAEYTDRPKLDPFSSPHDTRNWEAYVITVDTAAPVGNEVLIGIVKFNGPTLVYIHNIDESDVKAAGGRRIATDREIQLARGVRTYLDDRLSQEHNTDGTHKQTTVSDNSTGAALWVTQLGTGLLVKGTGPGGMIFSIDNVGNMNVYGNLIVAGTLTFNNNLTVNGSETVNGNLIVINPALSTEIATSITQLNAGKDILQLAGASGLVLKVQNNGTLLGNNIPKWSFKENTNWAPGSGNEPNSTDGFGGSGVRRDFTLVKTNIVTNSEQVYVNGLQQESGAFIPEDTYNIVSHTSNTLIIQIGGTGPLDPHAWKGYTLVITSSIGHRQLHKITDNDDKSFTIEDTWNPDITDLVDKFEVGNDYTFVSPNIIRFVAGSIPPVNSTLRVTYQYLESI